MCVEGEQFMHSPLESGQIRLLKLHPGNSEDILITTLATVDLLKAPPFEALSYVWGGYHERRSLQINGCAVEIHEGLFNAIHTLRSSTFERLIWADAICINQSDNSERSHQVNIMGQIYETAENVAVYLGQPS
jgi:Heterokaryon incompatibility protein (HET)